MGHRLFPDSTDLTQIIQEYQLSVQVGQMQSMRFYCTRPYDCDIKKGLRSTILVYEHLQRKYHEAGR